ncbi:MAG: hypothetical protein AUJ71_02100 [Candidatus Omnitrophica bacterium CG1_02_49_16]|nr:MAG: hypothetical protein AUJ71_02100 [Candidatus Omnitrophica bacterium CG1_02_49_16]
MTSRPLFREQCTVIENKKETGGHYVLKLASSRIAQSARPGQFVQIACSDSSDPFLPRPFSFLTAADTSFSILYQQKGKGTKNLSLMNPGEFLWVLGPLGNGFLQTAKLPSPAVLVGGGYGIPPLHHFAQNLIKKIKKENVHVVLGARNKSLLLCEKEFKKMGVKLTVTTDDGSKGRRGVVTQVLERLFSSSLGQVSSRRMFVCGPTLMLKAVSQVAQKYEVPCEVSVEVPMACGFGACLGCAIEVNDSKGRRFAIACKEGPVFSSKEIVWK